MRAATTTRPAINVRVFDRELNVRFFFSSRFPWYFFLAARNPLNLLLQPQPARLGGVARLAPLHCLKKKKGVANMVPLPCPKTMPLPPPTTTENRKINEAATVARNKWCRENKKENRTPACTPQLQCEKKKGVGSMTPSPCRKKMSLPPPTTTDNRKKKRQRPSREIGGETEHEEKKDNHPNVCLNCNVEKRKSSPGWPPYNA